MQQILVEILKKILGFQAEIKNFLLSWEERYWQKCHEESKTVNEKIVKTLEESFTKSFHFHCENLEKFSKKMETKVETELLRTELQQILKENQDLKIVLEENNKLRDKIHSLEKTIKEMETSQENINDFLKGLEAEKK